MGENGAGEVYVEKVSFQVVRGCDSLWLSRCELFLSCI